MTAVARPAKLLLLLLGLALAALLAVQAGPATAASGDAEAAALKKCKKGLNAKRCRCPRGQRLVRSGRKFRCKRRSTPPATTNPGTTTTPPPAPPTEPAPTAPQAPPAGAQLQRDDAAFTQALSSTLLRRYEEGSYGYGRYAYSFLPDGQFLYCSYYYASSTVEANKAGTWQVEEGYTVSGYPGYTAGRVRIVGSDFDVRIGVEMYNDQAFVESGNASSVFTRGAFTRYPGGATTNCSTVS